MCTDNKCLTTNSSVYLHSLCWSRTPFYRINSHFTHTPFCLEANGKDRLPHYLSNYNCRVTWGSYRTLAFVTAAIWNKRRVQHTTEACLFRKHLFCVQWRHMQIIYILQKCDVLKVEWFYTNIWFVIGFLFCKWNGSRKSTTRARKSLVAMTGCEPKIM